MDVKKEYRRNRARILNAISRLRRQGFDVEIKVPAIPKKITEASVRRLRNITIEKIRKVTYAPDLETGEKISLQTYRNRYLRKRGTPADIIAGEIDRTAIGLGKEYPDTVPTKYQMAIEYVRGVVEQYPERASEIMNNAIDGAIGAYEEERVGRALSEMIEDDEILSPSEAYNIGALLRMSQTLARYLLTREDDYQSVIKSIDEEIDSYEQFDGEFEDW